MEKSKFQIEAIGHVKVLNNKFAIVLDARYLDGLTHIEKFSHLQIIYWGHNVDNPGSRKKVVVEKLFKKAPDVVGIFATRAPARPNPILISTIKAEKFDLSNGIIYTPFIDAEPGSPVLDIKPYFPMERVKNCKVPRWFEHWPQWSEETKGFNWADEINF